MPQGTLRAHVGGVALARLTRLTFMLDTAMCLPLEAETSLLRTCVWREQHAIRALGTVAARHLACRALSEAAVRRGDVREWHGGER
jgi:hypothetical protein